MYVADCAIHTRREDLRASEMLECVDYMGVQDTASAHPGFKNVATNVPLLSVDEVVYVVGLSDNGRRWTGRPEQEKLLLMKDILPKCSKPDQRMLDAFAKTLYTEMGCLLLNNHRRFLGCNKDASCLQKSMPSIFAGLWFSASDDRFDLTGDEQQKDSERVYMAAVKSRRLRELLHGWGAPPGLLFIQTLQERVVSFLCTLHQCYSVCDLAHHLLYTGWSQIWRGKTESLDVDQLLAQSCGAIGVGVMKPTNEHDMAGTKCFGSSLESE